MPIFGGFGPSYGSYGPGASGWPWVSFRPVGDHHTPSQFPTVAFGTSTWFCPAYHVAADRVGGRRMKEKLYAQLSTELLDASF